MIGREDDESSFSEIAVESKIDSGNTSDVSSSVHAEYLLISISSVKRIELEENGQPGEATAH